MINILVDDIVPIIVIMALGYICGKFSYFDDDQRQGLNKLVLNIALPAAIFGMRAVCIVIAVAMLGSLVIPAVYAGL